MNSKLTVAAGTRLHFRLTRAHLCHVKLAWPLTATSANMPQPGQPGMQSINNREPGRPACARVVCKFYRSEFIEGGNMYYTPKSVIDFVIGNPPYAGYKVFEPDFASGNFLSEAVGRLQLVEAIKPAHNTRSLKNLLTLWKWFIGKFIRRA
jgi:hypothetical protein